VVGGDFRTIAAERLGERIVAAAPFTLTPRPRIVVLASFRLFSVPYVLWELVWRWRGGARPPDPAYLALTETRVGVFGFKFGAETSLVGPHAIWPRNEVRARAEPGEAQFRLVLSVDSRPGPMNADGYQKDEATSEVISLLIGNSA
jgi:hypothetical protein